MTSRDLVKAAIAHQETPRVPYLIHFTQGGKEALAPHLDGGDVDRYVDNDVLRLPPPWWGWHELGPEWQGPEPPAARPTVRGHGDYNAFFETLARLRAETDKYLLVTIYGSHFEKAYFARGIENFLADLAAEPAFAGRLLSRIIEKNLVMLENILQAPEIDGVLLGSDWGSQLDLLMSPAVWEELIRPGEQAEYDLIHSYGKDVWVHSCGNIERILPSLVAMGLDVLNPVQPEAMDIARLKETYGRALTFWGGVSTQQTLPYGTPDEVRAEARRVRALMSAGGGYIFSPAQAIQDDVPPANMQALVEVAREGR
jgi:uroporphyrinogen decarboxylase